jgi:hypothetical protein
MSARLMCDVYHMDDNSLLLVFDNGRGLLYESRDEMLEASRRAAAETASQQSFNLVERLLPERETFLDRLPVLLEALPGLVHLPMNTLDYTDESLKRLDKALRKIGPDRVLGNPLFEALVAYLGETIRRRTGAVWVMLPDQDGILGPCLSLPATKRRYAPYMFGADVLEKGRAASAFMFVDAATAASFQTIDIERTH